MKYYYGNDYKEAVSNNPVEIKDTSVLEAYKKNYNVVIPATDELPEEVIIPIDNEELADDIHCGNTDDVEEYIANYLSDEYGFCVDDYCWDVEDHQIIVSQISWDTSEDTYSQPVVNDIPAERARDLLNKCIDWIDMHIHPDDRSNFIKSLGLSEQEKQILDFNEEE